MTKKIFTAEAKLNGRWWEISVTKGLPEHHSCNTQARKLDKIKETTQDAIAELLSIPKQDIEIKLELILPSSLRKRIEKLNKASQKFDEARQNVRLTQRETAEAFTDEGFTRKETGIAMGLGPQRIQQILEDA